MFSLASKELHVGLGSEETQNFLKKQAIIGRIVVHVLIHTITIDDVILEFNQQNYLKPLENPDIISSYQEQLPSQIANFVHSLKRLQQNQNLFDSRNLVSIIRNLANMFSKDDFFSFVFTFNFSTLRNDSQRRSHDQMLEIIKTIISVWSTIAPNKTLHIQMNKSLTRGQLDLLNAIRFERLFISSIQKDIDARSILNLLVNNIGKDYLYLDVNFPKNIQPDDLDFSDLNPRSLKINTKKNKLLNGLLKKTIFEIKIMEWVPEEQTNMKVGDNLLQNQTVYPENEFRGMRMFCIPLSGWNPGWYFRRANVTERINEYQNDNFPKHSLVIFRVTGQLIGVFGGGSESIRWISDDCSECVVHLYTPYEFYIGNEVGDKIDGFGVMKYETGTICIGDFVNGIFIGKGCILYHNNDIYFGEVNEHRTGIGIYENVQFCGEINGFPVNVRLARFSNKDTLEPITHANCSQNGFLKSLNKLISQLERMIQKFSIYRYFLHDVLNVITDFKGRVIPSATNSCQELYLKIKV